MRSLTVSPIFRHFPVIYASLRHCVRIPSPLACHHDDNTFKSVLRTPTISCVWAGIFVVFWERGTMLRYHAPKFSAFQRRSPPSLKFTQGLYFIRNSSVVDSVKNKVILNTKGEAWYVPFLTLPVLNLSVGVFLGSQGTPLIRKLTT